MIKGDRQEEVEVCMLCARVCVCVCATCGHLYSRAHAQGTCEILPPILLALLSGFGTRPLGCSTFTPLPALLKLH